MSDKIITAHQYFLFQKMRKVRHVNKLRCIQLDTYLLPTIILSASRFPKAAAYKVGVMPSSSDVFRSFFVAIRRMSK